MAQRDALKEKSHENWQAAELCRENAKINAATSRFYYALYLAVRYWADKFGFIAWHERPADVHECVARVVGQNAGEKAKNYRYLLNDLKGFRQTADYSPESIDDDDRYRDLIEKASAARKFFLG